MAKKPRVAAVKDREAKVLKADAVNPVKAVAANPKAATKPAAAAKPKVATKPAAAAKPKVATKPAAAAKSKAPMAKLVASSKRMHNSHFEAAQRMMQLAQLLSQDPEEAKVFGKKTGVYTTSGELTAAYR
jgi:plastocyanin